MKKLLEIKPKLGLDLNSIVEYEANSCKVNSVTNFFFLADPSIHFFLSHQVSLTPLLEALVKGNMDVASLLLKAEADIGVKAKVSRQ